MDASEQDNGVLWDDLKMGNVDALGRLYDLFVDDLFAYGLRFSNDRQLVMDSIHDLFLNLYKYRKKLAPTPNIFAYLCRSLKNQMFKKPSVQLVQIPDHLFFEQTPQANLVLSHEESLIESEFLDETSFRLSDALSSLSKKQKQCIFLRFNENRQYEEIAEIMNISVQTSRTIIYRAIKVLRTNLTLFLLLYLFFL